MSTRGATQHVEVLRDTAERVRVLRNDVAYSPYTLVSQEDWLEVSQADLDVMVEDYRRAEVSQRWRAGLWK